MRLDKRVAIYLIFPQNGLLDSHISAINDIISSGYVPLIVSNLPLSEKDRDRLIKNCWKIIERPNYGYDFGGYRDGILLLQPQLRDLEHLAILNDSAWFPVSDAKSWLDCAEELDVDFAGAASSYGADRVEAADYLSLRWNYSSSHKNFHYCSFALLASRQILKDPSFVKYWKRLRLSGDKKRTVRRGEIGLSQWVIKHGYDHASTLDLANLDVELSELSEERILQIFEHLIFLQDPRLVKARDTVLTIARDRAPRWREHVEKLILTAVTRQSVIYVLPEYTIKDRGFQFLKKSPVWLSRESSDTTARIASDFSGPTTKTIVSEIEAARQRFDSISS